MCRRHTYNERANERRHRHQHHIEFWHMRTGVLSIRSLTSGHTHTHNNLSPTSNSKNQKLTQYIFGAKLVQIKELIVRVQDRRAANDRHQNDIGCIVLRFEAVTCVTPALALTLARLWRRRWAHRIGGKQRRDVHIVHAGGEREEGEYNLPCVWRTEDAMRPKDATDHRCMCFVDASSSRR